MQQLMEKIRSVVAKYENELAQKGIACSVSKKYFETRTDTVSLPSINSFSILYEYFAKKRENENFKHQRNRMHCAVLRFYPTDSNLLKRKECKEYAFVLSKISRIEEGMTPRKYNSKEELVLKNIERKVLNVLEAAEKKGSVEICQQTLFDKIRYMSSKYGYRWCSNGQPK